MHGYLTSDTYVCHQVLYEKLRSGQFTKKPPSKTALLSYTEKVRRERMESAKEEYNDYITERLGEGQTTVSLSKREEADLMRVIHDIPSIKKIPLTDYELEKISGWVKKGEMVDTKADDSGKCVKIPQSIAEETYENLCHLLGLDLDVVDIKEDWDEVKSATQLYENHTREKEKKLEKLIGYIIGQGGIRQNPAMVESVVNLALEITRDENHYQEEKKKLFEEDGSRKRKRGEEDESQA